MNNKNIFLDGLIEKNKGNYTKAYELFSSIKDESLAKLEKVFLLINGLGVNKNYNDAILLLKEVEKDKNLEGAILGLLGELYLYNAELKDLSKALLCVENGIMLGNSICLKLKGDIYYHGIYGETNLEKSYNFYTEAADKNNSKAFLQLAYMNYYNEIKNASIDSAIKYLEKAIQFGENQAYFELALIYLDKEFDKYNLEKSIKYLKLSAKNVNSEADLRLQKIQ